MFILFSLKICEINYHFKNLHKGIRAIILDILLGKNNSIFRVMGAVIRA